MVRAVCDLPLGSIEVVQPAAIANLLGDVWLDEKGELREPQFDAALAVSGVRLHLYEKHRPRKGRKMGHLSAIGDTPEEAVERVLEAKFTAVSNNKKEAADQIPLPLLLSD